MLSKPQNL
ncbi:hypothetical protein D043_4881A, partial [Vibrio parahaemolyticus EKP-021]